MEYDFAFSQRGDMTNGVDILLLVIFLIISVVIIVLAGIFQLIENKREKKEAEIEYKRITELVREIGSKDGIQGLINITSAGSIHRKIAVSILTKSYGALACSNCDGTGYALPKYSPTDDSGDSYPDTFNHPLWGEAERSGFNFEKKTSVRKFKCRECDGIGAIIKH